MALRPALWLWPPLSFLQSFLRHAAAQYFSFFSSLAPSFRTSCCNLPKLSGKPSFSETSFRNSSCIALSYILTTCPAHCSLLTRKHVTRSVRFYNLYSSAFYHFVQTPSIYLFRSLTQQPNADHGRLILEVCRSHTMAHHSR